MADLQPPKFIIKRSELEELAKARLAEAESLFERNQYAGSMFLGGCSLECFLKVGICMALRLEGLPSTPGSAFKIHDFEALLLYSGFRAELEEAHDTQRSFVHILDEWKPDGRASLLYGAPSNFDEARSRRFFTCLTDQEIGVIPRLRSRISKPR